VVAYFAVLGVANGVWLARIPAIKQNLHLSDGALGLALLAAPAGLILGALIASRLARLAADRHRHTQIPAAAAALILPTLGLAPSRGTLMLALFAFGMASGSLDVGMNSEAVRVEDAAGRPLMTSFHACFSFGALAGALIGSAFAWAGIGPAINFATVSLPLACGAVLAGRWLLPDQHGNGADSADAVLPADRPRLSPAVRSAMTPALLLMALLAMCALLGEGAADGWSAVYLHDNLKTSAGLAALGYAGFSVAMAVGRLTGDRLAARFGSVLVLRGSGLTAAAGLACALASPDAAGAIVGLAIFGVGLSSTFPLLLSAAGRADPLRPTRGIAVVAGVGYVGMLGGPVLIGGLAGPFGLTTALVVPVLLAIAICAGAGVVRSAPTAWTSRSRPNSKSASGSDLDRSVASPVSCGNSAGRGTGRGASASSTDSPGATQTSRRSDPSR
jgi:predicted MFS family arabinose efflux permease